MKKFKITFIICLFMMVLMNSFMLTMANEDGTSYKDGYDDGYDEGYMAGRNSIKDTTPIVKIVQSLDTPEVEAGEKLEMKTIFRNDSSYSAYNLSITPTFEESNVLVYERPLTYSTMTALRSKEEIGVTFNIQTAQNAKEGTYPLKFKVEFKNAKGQVFTREETAYFKVLQGKSKPILNVQNINISNDNLQYGDTFKISFDIVNIGGSEAKETEIKLEGFTTETIMPINSRDYNYIGTIEGKDFESKSISKQNFTFKISPEIEVRDVAINATIKYKSYDDKDFTTTKSFYVTGITPKPKESGDKEEKKKDEPKLAKPKVIISSYDYSPKSIIAGDDFSFSFTCKNTSKDKDIRNMKITVSSKDGAFIITKGSNTFYEERMAKTTSLYKQIDLKAKQDLASNSYEVNVSFDYEDYSGEEYTSSETINIPVTEYSKLVINSASTSEGYVGNPSQLSFEYVNMGKATISNLTATVRGDFTPVQETTYIGNIQAGNSDYYDIDVIPTKEGMNYGTLILSFENSSGKKLEVTRDFESTAYVEQMPEPGLDEMEGMLDDDANKDVIHFETWQIVLAGLGTLLVSFIVARFITKKIALRKFENDL